MADLAAKPGTPSPNAPEATDGSAGPSGADARGLALDILGAVARRKRPLDEALVDNLDGKQPPLPRRDRAFVRQLVATALRRLGQIDALIDHCLDRPLPQGAGEVSDALRLGVTQLLFLNVPPHAAVDETVSLVDARGHQRYKNLTNAVLRRLAAEGPALAERQDPARLNTPDWMWDGWTRGYGADMARAIAEAHLFEAPLDFTVNGDPAAWADPLGATRLPTGSLRRPAGGLVTDLPGFADGAWWVQDAAAAIPARLFGDLTGKTAIDLCAAPGGKTAQLAAAGARVTAVDRSAKRLARLQENLARLNLTATTATADAALWGAGEPADVVLLDAPCTATGTIRRHPDIPRTKTTEDLAKLTGVQGRLLSAAVAMVKRGGTLIYCTCSLQPEEGPDRVAALLGAGAPLRRDPIRPEEVGGLAELITADGDLRSLPCHLAELGGLDGFYAARLTRV
jgi:16S rRNA (cytosine967-C5)-methyltransferase